LQYRKDKKIGADIVLGDQDMGVTLQRLAQAAQMTDFSKMENTNSQFEQAMKELAPEESGDYKTNLSSFVENLKTRENVSKIMNELREQAPYMVSAMLDERDAYMAAGLDILEDKPVTCAVLGIAHLDGVERNLKAKGWKITHANCPRK
jgi:pheromone shutdown protein TraB